MGERGPRSKHAGGFLTDFPTDGMGKRPGRPITHDNPISRR